MFSYHFGFSVVTVLDTIPLQCCNDPDLIVFMVQIATMIGNQGTRGLESLTSHWL